MRQIKKAIYLILSWVVVVPLSVIIPKDKSLIVFVTRFGNTFEGNLKYFYVYINQLKDEKVQAYYITEDKSFADSLSKDVPNVLYYPEFKTFIKMLRANTVVIDGNEWTNQSKIFFLFNAKKVQLWHGNGMKTIGLQNPYFLNSKIRQIKFKILQSYPVYDVVTLPSELQVKKRGEAFNKKNILLNGQPRNDSLFGNFETDKMTSYGTDQETIKKVNNLKSEGYRVIIYSPTWKVVSEKKQQILTENLNVSKLIPFLEEQKILLMFKLHPKDTLNYGKVEHHLILEYDKDKDIYPLFKDIDLMITDYSSIYMDYLLLDRPVVFFSYDQEEYVKNERGLQYDYDEITPGAKCHNTDELICELIKVLVEGQDQYMQQRENVRQMFYHYTDGNSSERVYQYIKNFL